MISEVRSLVQQRNAEDYQALNLGLPTNIATVEPSPLGNKLAKSTLYWRSTPGTLLDEVCPDGYVMTDMGSFDISDLMVMFDYLHKDYSLLNTPNTIWYMQMPDKKLGELSCGLSQGCVEFVYKDVVFRFFSFAGEHRPLSYLLAPNLYAAQDCANWLLKFSKPATNTILMYDGCWTYNKRLREELRRFTWDDICLPSSQIDEIQTFIKDFFDPKNVDIYTLLNIPRKRGAIFAGEPGCGKSLLGKILANTGSHAFIHVTSLQHKDKLKQDCIKEIFEYAEELAPCILFFEDLDSQIDNECRTVFLNALDGFKSCEGILVLATSNHPDKIDPALTNRPGRFDKNFVIKRLDALMRARYFMGRFARIIGDELPRELRQLAIDCANATSGQSTAYLQEIVCGAAIHWVSTDRAISFADAVRQGVLTSKGQVAMSGHKMDKEMRSSKDDSMGFMRQSDQLSNEEIDQVLEEIIKPRFTPKELEEKKVATRELSPAV